MSDEDTLRRAARWKAFYQEDGGLRDMIAAMHAARFRAMTDVEPTDTSQLQVLAIDARVVRELETMILSIIADGAAAKAIDERVKRIEAIPDSKRRYL